MNKLSEQTARKALKQMNDNSANFVVGVVLGEINNRAWEFMNNIGFSKIGGDYLLTMDEVKAEDNIAVLIDGRTDVDAIIKYAALDHKGNIALVFEKMPELGPAAFNRVMWIEVEETVEEVKIPLTQSDAIKLARVINCANITNGRQTYPELSEAIDIIKDFAIRPFETV